MFDLRNRTLEPQDVTLGQKVRCNNVRFTKSNIGYNIGYLLDRETGTLLRQSYGRAQQSPFISLLCVVIMFDLRNRTLWGNGDPPPPLLRSSVAKAMEDTVKLRRAKQGYGRARPVLRIKLRRARQVPLFQISANTIPGTERIFLSRVASGKPRSIAVATIKASGISRR